MYKLDQDVPQDAGDSRQRLKAGRLVELQLFSVLPALPSPTPVYR